MEDKRHYGIADGKKDKEFFSLNLTQPYRSQYGSVNPAGIVGAGIATTAVSTIVAGIFCKIMDGNRTI